MIQILRDRTPAPVYTAPQLDDDQQKVVAHRTGAMRVLAGPGTGKTTTLVAAMSARLVGEDKLQASEVLGLTFGRKAAIEWRDQVTRAVGGGAVPQVATFHSFCYALVRAYAPVGEFREEVRLLSGPEQQQRARQMFADSVSDGNITWPEELREALGTRGLAEEIRTVMSRTRAQLMDPQNLEDLGRVARRDTWTAIGQFMEEYLSVLDFEDAIDYSELIYRAALIASQPEVQADLHKRYKAIYVDEYQDTDPGQVALLKALVSPSASLIVVGDIDQAIYGFRGADESGIRHFDDVFGHHFGAPVADVVLSTCRRFGPTIRNAAKAVIDRQRPAGMDQELIDKHRNLHVQPKEHDSVEVLTFDSDGAQAAYLADLIMRAHVEKGYSWDEMAVIVRSAVVSMPAIHRAMVSSGIPVEIAADEIPLHQDSAVEPLVHALRVIDNERALTPDMALTLLQGPLGGVDPVDVRRLGQYLRQRDSSPEHAPRPAHVLIRDSIAEPTLLLDVPRGQHDSVVAAITKLGSLLIEARKKMNSGATPHEVAWLVWQGTAWASILERNALGFGPAAQRANRDLDAICAFFDAVARFISRGRGKDLTNFLAEIESQEIPAESLAENSVRSNSVRLLTAHRSKGLQWKFVVVAGAQEDLWPNLRMRNTLLMSERIGRGVELMPATTREVLEEERRLFYVAMTRAQEHLVITAVDTSASEEGTVPSRFMVDVRQHLGLSTFDHRTGRPQRALTVDGVIASLRRTLADAQVPQVVRRSAAAQLSRLATHGSDAFANARPDAWWGSRSVTHTDAYLSEPLSLSPSGVSSIEECPAKWYLDRQVQATGDSQTYFVFGNTIHAIAEALQRGQLEYDLDAVTAQIDRVWPSVGYETGWEAKASRKDVQQCAERLFAWLVERSEVRALAESELVLETTLPVTHDDGTTRDIALRINGRADRIEFTADGVVVYDFKTGKKPKEGNKLPTDIQLALYSLLIKLGTHTVGEETQTLPAETPVKGAALVQLRSGIKGADHLPIEQFVTPDTHDEESEIPLTERLTNAAVLVLDEQYEARFDENNCRNCHVRILCPAAPEGREVLS